VNSALIGITLASLLTAGCSLDRHAIAGPADAGCEPGRVDLNRDPSDGCECILSEPPDEQCNAADDDCDGVVDEALSRSCGVTTGDCSGGAETCTDGSWGDCEGGVEPDDEACGGGDEDCDGTIDEGCACTPDGTTRPCGIDVGICELGMQTCASDTWSACEGGRTPSMETCNGEDDDCNGTVDGMERPCRVSMGICRPGVETCADGDWGACLGGVEATVEACDAAMLDEDCDGMANEDCACIDGVTGPCGTDVGECVAGTQTCSGGRFTGPCAGEVGPATETCEMAMLDEDCDGMTNEGCTCTEGETQPCTMMGCGGMQTCRLDGTWGSCVAAGVGLETCNGLDDDCNGIVDDGAAGCAARTGCDVHHRTGGNTYLVCDIDMSWAVGSTLCSGVGYTHITVTDAAEETYMLGLMRMYPENQWWCGLCDLGGDGVYDDDEWMGPDSSHRNWQASQPDALGNCARIRDTDGRWDDQPPDFGRGTICESAPP